MYLETDSSVIKFPVENVELEANSISFFQGNFLYLNFENEIEKNYFFKKIIGLVSDYDESFVELNKDFIAICEKVSDNHFHSTMEKSNVEKYEIKKGLIKFFTKKGAVKIFMDKDLIKKIKDGLNDINRGFNS